MGVFFAVLTALFWSVYNLFVRKGGDKVDPGAGYVLTLLLNVAFNFAFVALPVHQNAGPTAWAIVFFVLAGMSTSLLGRFLFFQGVFTVGPSRTSAWKNAAPVYSLILGAVFLSEGITWLSVGGVVVTLLGMVALAREQGRDKDGKPKPAAAGMAPNAKLERYGLIFAFSSGVAFAVGFLLRKAGLLQWSDPTWGNLIGSIAALVSWAPFAIAKGEVTRLWHARRTPGLRFWVAAGVFSSLAQLSSFIALKDLTTAIAQVISSLEPVFTILLSLVILGSRESINRRLVVATSVVCVGVALVAIRI